MASNAALLGDTLKASLKSGEPIASTVRSVSPPVSVDILKVMEEIRQAELDRSRQRQPRPDHWQMAHAIPLSEFRNAPAVVKKRAAGETCKNLQFRVWAVRSISVRLWVGGVYQKRLQPPRPHVLFSGVQWACASTFLVLVEPFGPLQSLQREPETVNIQPHACGDRHQSFRGFAQLYG